MNKEEVLAHIKSVNRITTDDVGINGEIENLIESALVDLNMSGIRKEFCDYPLEPIIVRAIGLYVKSQFGFDNPESEKIMSSYLSLEKHLSLSNEYGGGDSETS